MHCQWLQAVSPASALRTVKLCVRYTTTLAWPVVSFRYIPGVADAPPTPLGPQRLRGTFVETEPPR